MDFFPSVCPHYLDVKQAKRFHSQILVKKVGALTLPKDIED